MRILKYIDAKTLSRINISALIITAICEVFVLYTFFTKGLSPDIEPWKYKVIIAGVVLVSLLFLMSLIFMVLFIVYRKSK
ncbi:MAG: hypothetical protein PF436_14265 [Prolixibacteraceae bacterium]|jgi:F0F1-type ATP synthase membrane subunit c/vacuolar-type H+-ATPase subunit K|nr:hypothetical protein [Prolixibacteraceae bacterium]